MVATVGAVHLVVGLSFGFVLGRHLSERGGSPRDVAHDPELLRIADPLGLEPSRAARVRAILASCGPRFDAILEDSKPKLRALHEQLLGELKAELTPEQMEQLQQEYRKRFGEFPHGQR